VSLDFGFEDGDFEVILGGEGLCRSYSSCDLIALQEIDRYRGFEDTCFVYYEGNLQTQTKSPEYG
jgi:hypothetical protein